MTRVFFPFECIVRLSLKCSLGARVEPALQFLNVEMRFLMLTEGSTLGISFLFCLESLYGARFSYGTDVQCAEKRRRARRTPFVWFSIKPFFKPESIINRKATTMRNGLINRRGNRTY